MPNPSRIRTLRSRLCLLAALAMPGAAWAASETYQLDPVHTRVLFSVSHAGFSQAMGTVSGSTGLIEFDPDDWSRARVQVSVPLDRADLGDAAWNKAVAASNLLDVKDHPRAEFVSTRVMPRGGDHFDVVGQLTLHGVTREVTLAVTFNQLKRHPLPPFRRTAGFSATTTLSRAAFGIDAWPSVIGDAVQLNLQVEATRTREALEPAAATPADPASPSTPAQEPATP
ncbi:polyisoprenoid-binding protein [Pseudoxanthomonas winnipegensis]|jgi:polyisoprenoid-binding protein YceI|uniref:Polyisoprenoid-binding protein n=1 Tax=Pseudoxanthomonas winnipegensis TaxID=2480810 RepID=A0ABY1WDH6_9GAMM|nr:YceI family protein [Pseudoxanthomonas winnipegensis]TAA12227.1 polyisoprenoid-binding protein [Pseudoxanthomonas winnipegensis]TAA19408.1 polyisoprenoid-binding protein [Pseudoxanthomonas winnipegensis]TAH70241.1 polyisoprenoid-binding protein [Pseudoxanthomonas winnipegensis]